MDEKTAQYYRSRVNEAFQSYDAVASPLAQDFALAFPAGARVLDIGCGSGRDLRALLKSGYDAYGIEPVAEWRDKLSSEYPEISARVFTGHLPELPTDEKYQGIVCNAVLMHIPQGQQLEAFINLRDLLDINGRLVLSLPASRDDLDEDFRDPDGRLFVPSDPDRVRLLAEQTGFSFISMRHAADALGRSGISWNVLIFEKDSESTRPLDRVESVFKGDRKVATYKFALLRAFCDIAERDENAVTWCGNGYVGMPISALSECWLSYYWPLITASEHIPQSQTDGAASKRPVTFRGELAQLNKQCCEEFDPVPEVAFTVFNLAWKKGVLSKSLSAQLHKTLLKIKTAIIQGPVAHTAQGNMFWYDKNSGLVMLDVELWREFCLSGHWIRDSIILRWSDLCEHFSNRLGYGLKRADIIRIFCGKVCRNVSRG